jgi:hypothetical protein
VTVHSDDIGNTFGPNGFSIGSSLLIHPAPADFQQGRDVVDGQEFMKLWISLVTVVHLSLLDAQICAGSWSTFGHLSRCPIQQRFGADHLRRSF